MHFPTLAALIADSKRTLTKGPIALLLVDDSVEVDSTLAHLEKLGFGNIIAFARATLQWLIQTAQACTAWTLT